LDSPSLKKYFSYFGLPITASIDELKKSYRILALKLHPDRNKSEDAHIEFTELQQRYEKLMRFIESGSKFNHITYRSSGKRSAEPTSGKETKSKSGANRPNYSSAQQQRIQRAQAYINDPAFRKVITNAKQKDNVLFLVYIFSSFLISIPLYIFFVPKDSHTSAGYLLMVFTVFVLSAPFWQKTISGIYIRNKERANLMRDVEWVLGNIKNKP
jgi:hypothetical protein